MSLAIRGNDFCKFFGANKAKIELVKRKWTQKSTLLANLTVVGWAYLPFFKFVWKISVMFFSSFLSVFSYQGERF